MTKEIEKRLLDVVEHELVSLGFRRSGRSFFRDDGEVILIVNFQKGQKSTKDLLVVAVNLGAFSKRLGGDVKAPDPFDGQWRRRLGTVSPPREKWWEASDISGADRTAAEVLELLRSHGLPALEDVSTDRKLRLLWESGRSPGLTDGQRLLCLARLNKIAGLNAP